MKKLLAIILSIIQTVVCVKAGNIHHEIPFDSSESSMSELLAKYPSAGQKTMRSEAVAYRPMLELGKEWRYNIKDIGYYGEPHPDREMFIKVEEKIEHDGKEYYRMAEYEDGEQYDVTDLPIYWWEDVDNRRIWGRFSIDDENEFLLYDFVNPADGWYSNTFGEEYEEDTYFFEAFDGMHRARGTKNKYVALVEGFGVIGYGMRCNDPETPWYWCLGDVLAGPIGGCAGNCILPILYEIVNGDGEVVYSLDVARPSSSVCSIASDSKVSIRVTDGSVEVESGNEIGRMTVVSASGITVFSGEINDRQFTYRTSELAAGVYMVHAGNETKKFIVR